MNFSQAKMERTRKRERSINGIRKARRGEEEKHGLRRGI